MKVRLKTAVEFDGATFYFVPDDETFWKVGDLIDADVARHGSPNVPFELLSADTQSAFAAFFVASVVEWEGVTDEDDKALSCTASAKQAVDPLTKAQIVLAYYAERERLRGNASEPASPPTSSTDPEPTEGT